MDVMDGKEPVSSFICLSYLFFKSQKVMFVMEFGFIDQRLDFFVLDLNITKKKKKKYSFS